MILSGTYKNEDGFSSTEVTDWRADAFKQRFWVVVAIIFGILVTISAQLEYARLGGEEVYDELTTGATFTRQIAFLGLAGLSVACYLLYQPAAEKVPYWPILLPIFFLVALINMSTLWSDIPSMTLKRAIVISIIVVSGVVIGRIWDGKCLALAIVLISGGFLILSVIAELYYRSFLMADYRFSGVLHPSRQAFNCGLLAVASTVMFFDSHKKRYLLLALVAIGFVLLTKSRTGLAATLIASGSIAWFQTSWNQRIIGLGVLSLLGLGGLIGTSAFAPSYEVDKVALLGRNEETADPRKLTGRIPIWTRAISEFSERPILGFGYGAFWSKERLEAYARANGWALAHSHSAYVEALVNMGTIGFMIGLGLLCAAYLRLRRLRSGEVDNVRGHLGCAIMIMAALASLTEIAFIADGYEAWVMASTLGLVGFSGLPMSLDGTNGE
jgi:exopolysaccharide production protein ExoQ